jgi:hypothetical protein
VSGELFSTTRVRKSTVTQQIEENREKAVLDLAKWVEKERRLTVQSFPRKTHSDTERAISHAQAVFLVPRVVAQELADAAFGLAHERYVAAFTKQ